MDIEEYAAFSAGDAGGNPAGVVIGPHHPDVQEMRRIAAELGHSETAFAAGSGTDWTVRYFAPDSEVPFCGHATIALGAALARRFGSGTYDLTTAAGPVSVAGEAGKDLSAALTSPPSRHAAAAPDLVKAACALFGWAEGDLIREPVVAEAGARHLVLSLPTRGALADMSYDFATGQALMRAHDLITIMLIFEAEDGVVHARNPFASGGVYEDPATGAAAAALGGWYRDAGLRTGAFDIWQGDDMGVPSRLHVAPLAQIGSSIRVSGAVREMRGTLA